MQRGRRASRCPTTKAANVRMAAAHLEHAGRELEAAGYPIHAEDVRRVWARLRRLEGITTKRARAVLVRVTRHLRRVR